MILPPLVFPGLGLFLCFVYVSVYKLLFSVKVSFHDHFASASSRCVLTLHYLPLENAPNSNFANRCVFICHGLLIGFKTPFEIGRVNRSLKMLQTEAIVWPQACAINIFLLS